MEIWWTMRLDTRSRWCLENLSASRNSGLPAAHGGGYGLFASSAVSSSPSSTSLSWRTTFLATVLRALEMGTILGCAGAAAAERAPGGGRRPAEDRAPWRRRGGRARAAMARGAMVRASKGIDGGAIRSQAVTSRAFVGYMARARRRVRVVAPSDPRRTCNCPKKRSTREHFVTDRKFSLCTSGPVTKSCRKKSGRALGSSWRHIIGCLDGNPSSPKVPPPGVFVSASPRRISSYQHIGRSDEVRARAPRALSASAIDECRARSSPGSATSSRRSPRSRRRAPQVDALRAARRAPREENEALRAEVARHREVD